MSPTSETIAVVAAISAAQFAGAWTYLTAKRKALTEPAAAIACGVVTTLVAAPAFIALDVHHWILGPETNWGLSVFLAVCGGITQGALFRGRPLSRRDPSVGVGGA